MKLVRPLTCERNTSPIKKKPEKSVIEGIYTNNKGSIYATHRVSDWMALKKIR